MSLTDAREAGFVAGIDIGSTLSKAVVTDATGRIKGTAFRPTGGAVPSAAGEVLTLACASIAGPGALSYVVSTGYGRFKVDLGDEVIPEVACHARGAAALVPGVATLIDIGGQDTKVIRVDPDGAAVDFCMNDERAAGTGRFVEAAADAAGVDLDELVTLALQADAALPAGGVCAVLIESEVHALLADGHPLPGILRGLCEALARRVAGLAERIGVVPPVAVSGGVSRNRAVVRALERCLRHSLAVPEEALYAGALGAALFAADRLLGLGELPARAASHPA